VGVAKNLIEVVAKPEPGIAFCHRIPERASKPRCNEAIGEEIDVLSAADPVREAMCAEVEAAYVQACRYGARLRATRPPGLAAAN
jgi:hypothetical protein